MSSEEKSKKEVKTIDFATFCKPELRNWLISYENFLREEGENIFAFRFFRELSCFNFVDFNLTRKETDDFWAGFAAREKQEDLTLGTQYITESIEKRYNTYMESSYRNSNVIICNEIQYPYLIKYFTGKEKRKRVIICHATPREDIQLTSDPNLSSFYFFIGDPTKNIIIQRQTAVSAVKKRGATGPVLIPIDKIFLGLGNFTLSHGNRENLIVELSQEQLSEFSRFSKKFRTGDQTEETSEAILRISEESNHSAQATKTVWFSCESPKNGRPLKLVVPEEKKKSNESDESSERGSKVYFFINGYIGSPEIARSMINLENEFNRDAEIVFTSISKNQAKTILGQVGDKEVKVTTADTVEIDGAAKSFSTGVIRRYFIDGISPLEQACYQNDWDRNAPLIEKILNQNSATTIPLEKILLFYKFFAMIENFPSSETLRLKGNILDIVNISQSKPEIAEASISNQKDYYYEMTIAQRKTLYETIDRMMKTKKSVGINFPYMREDVGIRNIDMQIWQEYKDKEVEHCKIPEERNLFNVANFPELSNESDEKDFLLQGMKFLIVDLDGVKTSSKIILGNCDFVVLKGAPEKTVNLRIFGKIHTLINSSTNVRILYDNVTKTPVDLFSGELTDQFIDYPDKISYNIIGEKGTKASCSRISPEQFKSERTIIRNYHKLREVNLPGTLIVLNVFDI